MEDRKQRILGDPKYVISVICLAISQVFYIGILEIGIFF